MVSLLHISDLHRTAGPRIHNDQLFTAIASDATRWAAEGIPKPDVIVVSGDLVQGARVADPDADGEMVRQYGEATDFLSRLATQLVDGDRRRVVIVPGNHDVSWRRAHAAMTPLAACPPDVGQKSLDADSGIRWDWSTQQAFEISDSVLYESRLELFRAFRDDFYAGIDPSPLIDTDMVFFDYPDLGLAKSDSGHVTATTASATSATSNRESSHALRKYWAQLMRRWRSVSGITALQEVPGLRTTWID